MKTSINLLPAVYQRQLIVRRRVTQWAAVLGVVLSVGAAVRWTDMDENRAIHQRLELLSREHAPTQIMLKQLVGMRRELDELQHLDRVAAELEYQRPALSLMGLLSDIGVGTNGKLRVTKLEVTGLQQPPAAGKVGDPAGSGRGLTVSGLSLDNPSVARLVTGLAESGFFARTFLVKSKEQSDDEGALREYEVRCEF